LRPQAGRPDEALTGNGLIAWVLIIEGAFKALKLTVQYCELPRFSRAERAQYLEIRQ
jgi:hypothetical protein